MSNTLYKGDGTAIEVSGSNSESFGRKVPWQIWQHRGIVTNEIYQETAPSLYESFKNGTDAVEVDVVSSKDGVLILSHDNNVTVDGTNYVIAQTDYNTLKSLPLTKSSTYGNYGYLSLEDALQMCRYYGKYLILDSVSNVTEAKQIAKMVVNNGMGGKCVYLLWNQTLATNLVSIANAVLEVDREAYIETTYDGTVSDGYFHEINTDESHIIIGIDKSTDSDLVASIRSAGYKILTGALTKYDSISQYVLPVNPDFVMYEYSWMTPRKSTEDVIASIDFGKGVK